MTFHFVLLSKAQTLKDYPPYYGPDILCFLIFKDSQKVGLYGLIDRGIEQGVDGNQRIGEGFLTIFPKFRFKVMSRTFLEKLLSHPFEVGFEPRFEKVYTWTQSKSWVTLLKHFISADVQLLESPPPWDDDTSGTSGKVWFVKAKKSKETDKRKES